MDAHNTSAVQPDAPAVQSASTAMSASQARASTIAGTSSTTAQSSSTSAFESPPAGRASTVRSSTPTRPSSAAPRAPDADLVRLLADGRSAVCPPQDAPSAIARPPRDADAPDGYFAGYCVVV